ncbi:DUF393 domain-containing protein [Phycicoccus sp. BSK3Z-2]|uniref:DUF393 domain-containing protein n=1 Tax=Phycicoccus avicenniae TaxID=2828860 RepID=A0A941D632_9MICO|nr:DUF393 domain-containing protein [Phycicoccus avicenniae]MBR7742794.1 DUF393 domain-containing protein [Phycicoccus avicenniae]
MAPHPPVLVFDGDCAFCTSSARLLARLRRSPGDFAVEPWQRLDLPALGLTEEQCSQAVQWVARDGRVSAAERGIARSLLASRVMVRPVGALLLAPAVRPLAGVVYRWVARNRSRMPGGTPACALPPAGTQGEDTRP